MHNKADSTGYSTPYKFTGKEVDSETGLYAFKHRYYDARLGRWLSADPPLATGGYLPTGNKKKDKNLPGMGGVYNPVNLDAYHYAGLNPLKFIDPDGNTVTGTFYITSIKEGKKSGHTATGYIVINDDDIDKQLKVSMKVNVTSGGSPSRAGSQHDDPPVPLRGKFKKSIMNMIFSTQVCIWA